MKNGKKSAILFLVLISSSLFSGTQSDTQKERPEELLTTKQVAHSVVELYRRLVATKRFQVSLERTQPGRNTDYTIH